MASTIPKRRWYQFSLRSLLVVMTVATVTFGGWVQFRRQRAQANRDRVAAVDKAVAEIEELGGWAMYNVEDMRPQTWLEEHFDDPGGSDDPVCAVKVLFVSLDGPKVTDASLKLLKELKSLQYLGLGLSGTNVTDTGLERLQGLSVGILDLSNTNVTDAGLERLKGMSNLEELDLTGTKVTNEGVKKLQQALPNCEIRH